MPHALLVIHRERLCSGVIGTTARDRRNCAAHDRCPVLLELGEANHEPSALRRLAPQKCDLFCVLANAQKSSTEIRFPTLLLNAESNQRSADQVRNECPCHRINDCCPNQIARDSERLIEQREWSSIGETPQYHDEGAKSYHGTKQACAKRQGAGDE